MVQTAKEGIRIQASNSEIYGKMQEVFIEMDAGYNVSQDYHTLWQKKKEMNTALVFACSFFTSTLI